MKVTRALVLGIRSSLVMPGLSGWYSHNWVLSSRIWVNQDRWLPPLQPPSCFSSSWPSSRLFTSLTGSMRECASSLPQSDDAIQCPTRSLLLPNWPISYQSTFLYAKTLPTVSYCISLHTAYRLLQQDYYITTGAVNGRTDTVPRDAIQRIVLQIKSIQVTVYWTALLPQTRSRDLRLPRE